MSSQWRKQGALRVRDPKGYPTLFNCQTHLSFSGGQPLLCFHDSQTFRLSFLSFPSSLTSSLTHLLVSVYWALCLGSTGEYSLQEALKPHGRKRCDLYNAKGDWEVHLFAKAAERKYREPEGLNDRSMFSPSSGDWTSKTRVSAGLVPSEGCEGESVPRPSSFCWFSGVLGVPWVVDATPQISAFIFPWSKSHPTPI